jgi:hypothetical protein
MSAPSLARRAIPAGGVKRRSVAPATLAVYANRPHLPEVWEAEPMPARRLGHVGDVLTLRALHPCAVAVVVTPGTSLERLATELQALVDMLRYGPDPQGPAAVCTMPGFRR